MSEFRDVCMAMREICRHERQCIDCSLHRFCEHMPVSWSINEIDEAERIAESCNDADGETSRSAGRKNEIRPVQADIDDAYYEYGRKHQEGKR